MDQDGAKACECEGNGIISYVEGHRRQERLEGTV